MPAPALSYPLFGHGIGLHRMQALCEEFLASYWAKDVDPIHVVGTNGKGSVSAIIAKILQTYGLETGLYTSPHMMDWRERIVIEGEAISLEDWIDGWKWLEQEIEEQGFEQNEVGRFEALTAIAIRAFKQKQLEAVVLEAGIGGRFDPSRILAGHTNLLTTLELEHTQLLGNTLAEIASDKLDICPPKGKVFFHPIFSSSLTQHIQTYSQLNHIQAQIVHHQYKNLAVVDGKMQCDLTVGETEWKGLQSAMFGFHQIGNMALAIEACEDWLKRKGYFEGHRFREAVREALRTIKWAGRLEEIRADIWVDVGHTPQAMNALAQWMEFAESRSITLLLGISAGRQADEMLKSWETTADHIILTEASERPQNISNIDSNAEKIPDWQEALETAIQYAKSKGGILLITGSLFLVRDAKRILQA